MSHRREQLESSLQKTVGMVIAAGLADPRVRGMISVTKVELGDEGRLATVSVSVMPEQYESRSIAGLRSSAGWIRAEAGKRLRTRTVPHLRFELDRSLKKQAELYAALNEVARERAEKDDDESSGPASAPADERADATDRGAAGHEDNPT